eukprot:2109851-Prymnesium_polylepis.1
MALSRMRVFPSAQSEGKSEFLGGKFAKRGTRSSNASRRETYAGMFSCRRVPLGRASPQAFSCRRNANAGLVTQRRTKLLSLVTRGVERSSTTFDGVRWRFTERRVAAS